MRFWLTKLEGDEGQGAVQTTGSIKEDVKRNSFPIELEPNRSLSWHPAPLHASPVRRRETVTTGEKRPADISASPAPILAILVTVLIIVLYLMFR
jgi:hypothetical protein